jgi:hypothetical protein
MATPEETKKFLTDTMNEVLDARDAAKTEREKKEKEEAEKTNKPKSFLDSLLGS